jgi:hypothetical protein
MYIAQGNQVLFQHHNGETDLRAYCDDAQKAADMLNKAGYLNDVKRKYTAAARLIADVENLPGYREAEDDHDQRAEDEHNYNVMIGRSLGR